MTKTSFTKEKNLKGLKRQHQQVQPQFMQEQPEFLREQLHQVL
jgi:DNA-binding protein YbaB